MNSLDNICNFDVTKRSNFEILDSWNKLLDEKFLIDVIEGRSVLITTSVFSKKIQELYELKSHVTDTGDKRNPASICTAIKKELFNHDKLYYM